MSADNIPESGDPHAASRIHQAGTPLAEAHSAMIMIHGRGATAESILSLAAEFRVPGIAYLAPQAVGYAWYPLSFLAPRQGNEPFLSSALAVVGRAVAQAEAAGIPARRTYLLGFSQGACLASEWSARNARRYGGLFALSGGLIGDRIEREIYQSGFDGMPAFLGCSDVDGHIPATRVQETATVLGELGASVDMRLYRGMGHTVNQDEIDAIVAILEGDRRAQETDRNGVSGAGH